MDTGPGSAAVNRSCPELSCGAFGSCWLTTRRWGWSRTGILPAGQAGADQAAALQRRE
jgi:hypothetical protein